MPTHECFRLSSRALTTPKSLVRPTGHLPCSGSVWGQPSNALLHGTSKPQNPAPNATKELPGCSQQALREPTRRAPQSGSKQPRLGSVREHLELWTATLRGKKGGVSHTACMDCVECIVHVVSMMLQEATDPHAREHALENIQPKICEAPSNCTDNFNGKLPCSAYTVLIIVVKHSQV